MCCIIGICHTSGYPWPSDTVRHKWDVPAPSLLELQRKRRETIELGYPSRCRRQPRKHRGLVPVHPRQKAQVPARTLPCPARPCWPPSQPINPFPVFVRPGPVICLWRTRAPSRTDVVNLWDCKASSTIILEMLMWQWMQSKP
jgi:hypothetical protein